QGGVSRRRPNAGAARRGPARRCCGSPGRALAAGVLDRDAGIAGGPGRQALRFGGYGGGAQRRRGDGRAGRCRGRGGAGGGGGGRGGGPGRRVGMTTRSANSRLWIGGALMALLAGIATREAWADIYMIASTDEESSHIFLVPVVALWMAWLRRARLRHLAPRPSPLGPVVVLAGWASMLVGYNFAMQSLWHGGALLTVLGGFISVAGHSVALRLMPAFA